MSNPFSIIPSITPSYTYDDILIKPRYSNIKSRKYLNLFTQLTPNVSLNVPIISSNMDHNYHTPQPILFVLIVVVYYRCKDATIVSMQLATLLSW